MENKNNFLVKMDLSCMPTDIIPFIGKHLLTYDNKFKFNKIFKKKQDIALLKFFFGEDDKLFKFINNYIGNKYKIECKDINLNPLMECINNTYNLNIKKIRLLYHPNYIGWITHEDFKYYNEDGKRIKLNKVKYIVNYGSDSDEEEMDENYYNRKIISDKINEMQIKNKITKFHNDFYAYEMEKRIYTDSDTD